MDAGTDSPPPLLPRTLYAFDFDHTILDGNSDTEVVKVVPTPLPQEVRGALDGQNCLELSWTKFMNDVFTFLHQHQVSVERMQEFVRKMPPTPGMVSLLQELHHVKGNSDSKLLIISDANDIFISAFLGSIGVEADFVITNKATVSEAGLLQIEPYENQEHCPICPRNLCKGSALLQYLKSQGSPFSSIVYVGDGRNDVCPGIKLSPRDFLFARRGYGLEKILKRGKVVGIRKNSQNSKDADKQVEETEIHLEVKAQIHFWDDAATIRNVIFSKDSSTDEKNK